MSSGSPTRGYRSHHQSPLELGTAGQTRHAGQRLTVSSTHEAVKVEQCYRRIAAFSKSLGNRGEFNAQQVAPDIKFGAKHLRGRQLYPPDCLPTPTYGANCSF
ncbi:MAG: hypothetical protein IPN42_08720 [Methylococcaceae bacterium]|nr:hypothetical protein [Methylococcaceae bacterium]